MKMKRYTAILNNGKGHIHRTDDSYSSKKHYAHDCRANSYKVTAILTDEEIDHIKEHRWLSGLRYSDLVIDFVLQCL